MGFSCLCKVPVSPKMVVGHVNGDVRLQNIATGKTEIVYSSHAAEVKALAVARDWVASGSVDGTIHISSLADASLVAKLTSDHSIVSLIWWKNLLCMGFAVGNICIYDMASLSYVAQCPCEGLDLPRHMQSSASGLWVLSKPTSEAVTYFRLKRSYPETLLIKASARYSYPKAKDNIVAFVLYDKSATGLWLSLASGALILVDTDSKLCLREIMGPELHLPAWNVHALYSISINEDNNSHSNMLLVVSDNRHLYAMKIPSLERVELGGPSNLWEITSKRAYHIESRNKEEEQQQQQLISQINLGDIAASLQTDPKPLGVSKQWWSLRDARFTEGYSKEGNSPKSSRRSSFSSMSSLREQLSPSAKLIKDALRALK